ncbi:curli polymerization inhibitor CsgI-related protein [Spirabiliibacterium falconis]|uniref:curli polymerization inhibitor CsgI-related protein n=1 Tax=Spirabiliibacterium falconis TaxID=572023 RepID=UPI001AAD6DC3|nr:DUF2057 domain-containing protein [Spirabiliibacterium falconis]MBE2893826.1 DUF2057 domain-containing protein [Spirabiliibacterium falconis]
MKLTRLALAVVAVATGVSAVAADISTSSNVTLLAFDGQKISKGLFQKDKSIKASDNAVHQVVVKVEEIVRVGSDRRFYESSPIVVKFNTGTENVVIKAENLGTDDAAARFDRNPKVSVVTQSGQVLASSQELLDQEGLFPNRNLQENLSNYNSSNKTASVSSFAVANMPVMAGMSGVGKAQKGKVTVQGENVAEQQLQYWFQQADKETQKRFLNWAKKQ